ncbi:MAG TPA: DUF4214 domain-containing protein [Candidatus Dormibacteraeota bacterium]|nr:DUF4214 domain-containing protein [Candidatus Dormibacteraeota bacterium]
MTTPTNDTAPLRGRSRRGRMRPVASGAAGILICAVTLGAVMGTHPQTVSAVTSSITAADLLSIDHNTGSWIGGAAGVVVHRTASGDVLDNLPTAIDVNAIVSAGRDVLGNEEVYAAGDHGALYYKAGSAAWCRIAVPSAVFGENLTALASFGPGHVEVAGTDGLVMELTGPASCAATFVVDARVPGSATLNAIEHLASGTVVAAGNAGTMLVGHFDSVVHHLLFSPVVSDTLADIYGLAPSVHGVVAVGAGGLVVDGVISIDPQTLLPALVGHVLGGIPTVSSLRDAAAGFAGDATNLVPSVVAVGGNGTILRSVDGGLTWSITASGSTSTLHGVQLTGLTGGIAVGAAGTLITLTFSAPSTPTPSPSGSATPTPTASPSASPSGSPSATPTPSGSPSATPSPSPSASPTATPSPSPSPSPSASPTATPSPSPDAGGTSTTTSTTTSSGGGTTTTTTSAGGGTTTTTTSGGGSSTVTNTVTSTATVLVTSVSTSTTTVGQGGGNGNGNGSGSGGSGSGPAPGTLPWAHRLVEELYLEVLSRTADSSGEAHWVDQVMGHGQGPVAIAHALLGSVEYRSNFVQSVYWQYLNRGGEPAGVNSWVAALGDGMTQETVRLAFLGSNEFFASSGGNARGYVDALYTTVLQRSPDAPGEAFWINRMAQGSGPYPVAASLVYSTEQLEQRVSGYYLTYLARTAGPGELASWAHVMAQGTRDEDVILGFVGSTEYLSRI